MDPKTDPNPNAGPQPETPQAPAAPEPAAAPVEVVGQPPAAPRPRLDQSKARDEMLILSLWIALAVVVVGLVLAVLKYWFRTNVLSESPGNRLGSFREMLENGEITQEEYDRILAKMASKMKGKPGATGPGSAPRLGRAVPPAQSSPSPPTDLPPPAAT
jgi:hypothetical protein